MSASYSYPLIIKDDIIIENSSKVLDRVAKKVSIAIIVILILVIGGILYSKMPKSAKPVAKKTDQTVATSSVPTS
ncbi:MAG: hypothetical protein NTY66_04285, partial [Candidatus Vogelbacteria bacterium]|nr:hypothetical protein [Candidatus Vogelbacteria bacterium]